MQLANFTLVTTASEDGQAGHVQAGHAPVMDDAARQEVHPSRGASTENPRSTAAVTSSGTTTVSDQTNVLALTAPASPLSIEALLQPLSPPYWLCQDHRVLSRRYHHHQYLSNHHHQGFLHHHHHIPTMACLFMFVSQFCGIPIPDWALSWQLCSN